MLLALDTSSNRTGWCLGFPAGSVQTGSARFPGYRDDNGGLLVAFDDWLTEFLKVDQIELIVLEKPVRPFSNANLTTFLQLYGIATHVEYVAKRAGIECLWADNQRIKKLIYGSGGKKPKNTVELARRWGFDPQNDDEADACGVYLLTLQHRFPEHFKTWLARRDAIAQSAGETLV